MTHKLIKTGNYLLVVDDSEIKVRDFCYNSIKNTWNEDIILYQDAMPKYHYVGFKKIIAHLPLNNSPILDGVDLLPLIENEVEKLAFDYTSVSQSHRRGFIDGYNKAKEKYVQLIEKQISDFTHDLRESTSNYVKQNCEGALFGLKILKQSLQQPKYPVEFECETVCGNLGCMKMVLNGENSVCCGDNIKPKTTINSQGITQWVGTYKYE